MQETMTTDAMMCVSEHDSQKLGRTERKSPSPRSLYDMDELPDDFYYVECGNCGSVAFSADAAMVHKAVCTGPPHRAPDPPRESDVERGCSRCGFTTLCLEDLVEHRMKSGHGCFACNLCHRFFSATKRGMAAHKREHHHAVKRAAFPREQDRIYDASVSAVYQRYFYGR